MPVYIGGTKHPPTDLLTVYLRGGSLNRKMLTYWEHINSPAGSRTEATLLDIYCVFKSSKVMFPFFTLHSLGCRMCEKRPQRDRNMKTPVRKMVLSDCQVESDNRLKKDSHLGEERARDKLFVLQKGDALAAIQLLGQICHVCLQLCKACEDK